MIYPYQCQTCSHKFDVIKPHALLDERETCDQCGSQDTKRYLVPSRLNDIAAEDAYWSHALGQVVKDTRQARRLAKERGMIEIGNESLESIKKHTDDEREKRLERSYDEVTQKLRTIDL